MPRRRRRGTAAAVVEADPERGLAMRVLLHSPKDTVAGLIAFAAAGAIIANALFLQAGPHPAPMFGSIVHIPAPAAPATTSLLPRPRPAEADVAPSEPRLAEPKAGEPRTSEPRAAADPLGNLVKATAMVPPPPESVAPSSNVPRPPAPIPSVQVTGSRRVAAVQRALSEFGYGQLKPTGTIGPDTQAEIQRFEHDRKIPASGQVSERLVRELSAMAGHPID